MVAIPWAGRSTSTATGVPTSFEPNQTGPGILAGAITAFAASLGEFGAIITFVSNIPGETRTLPLAIYTAIQTPGGETAAARLAALAIALAVTGLVLSEFAAQRVRKLSGR